MLKLHKRFAKKFRSKTAYRVCAMAACGVILSLTCAALSTNDTNLSFANLSNESQVAVVENCNDTKLNTVSLSAGAAGFVNLKVEDDVQMHLTAEIAKAKEATLEKQKLAVTTAAPGMVNIYEGITISDADYDALCRIVEAEAGNQCDEGKIMVANAVLNRVLDDRFPSTVYDVIYQDCDTDVPQFYGNDQMDYFNNIVPSDSTIACVDRALAGEDYSGGALYFVSFYDDSSWFNTDLILVKQVGAHYFYK